MSKKFETNYQTLTKLRTYFSECDELEDATTLSAWLDALAMFGVPGASEAYFWLDDEIEQTRYQKIFYGEDAKRSKTKKRKRGSPRLKVVK